MDRAIAQLNEREGLVALLARRLDPTADRDGLADQAAQQHAVWRRSRPAQATNDTDSTANAPPGRTSCRRTAFRIASRS